MKTIILTEVKKEDVETLPKDGALVKGNNLPDQDVLSEADSENSELQDNDSVGSGSTLTTRSSSRSRKSKKDAGNNNATGGPSVKIKLRGRGRTGVNLKGKGRRNIFKKSVSISFFKRSAIFLEIFSTHDSYATLLC